MTATKIWVDGIEAGALSTEDRGLLYGDGLFETLPIKAGTPILLEAHLERLYEGCQRLSIKGFDSAQLIQEVSDFIAGVNTGVLKIIITRGSGGRGYRPSQAMTPTRILQLHEAVVYPDKFWHEGIALRLCQTQLGKNPTLAGLKHLNRLEQVLARSEWDDVTIFEGLMCDSDGMLIEATQSNIFWVEKNILYTPDLSHCGVAGILRSQVLAHATKHGIVTRLVREPVSCLIRADEIFITNSVIGVMPVRQYEGQQYQPGPVTQVLQQHMGNV